MPHISLEYSANLDRVLEMDALCARVLAAAIDTGLFEPGAVRVRAIRADAYAIADRAAGNAFLDVRMRIGAGRSGEQKKLAGDAVFSRVVELANDLLLAGTCAVSLDVTEIDETLNWKRNAIAARLRQQP